MDCICVGGAVASWLVRSTPDGAVLVRALAEDIVFVFLGKTLYSHGTGESLASHDSEVSI